MTLASSTCLAVAFALTAAFPPAALSEPADDALTRAKTLFFDRQYAPAREAWTAVRAAGGGDVALYWIARCSDALGEHVRAFEEYGVYLATHPSDRVLSEEARTSRVGLAVRLYKEGRPEPLQAAIDALDDPSKTVRYFAALQLGTLGRELGRRAIPVLRRIVSEEKDPDLVERARLALLRVDARALPPAPAKAARGPGRQARWIRVRVFDAGKKEAAVSIDVPLSLADLVFKGLPDSARRELGRKGYEADSFLRRLRETGPAQILDVKGDDGGEVRIWIE